MISSCCKAAINAMNFLEVTRAFSLHENVNYGATNTSIYQLFEEQFNCKFTSVPAGTFICREVIEFNNSVDETAFLLRFS
ncbi:MAG: hypothetical protein RLY43_395 [Bacteroidota bacterium]|jgi:hypothetical protein